MVQQIRFKILGIPTPKARPRFASFGGKFTKAYKPAIERHREDTWISLAAQHIPATPLAGPVKVDLQFTFAVSKSWPKWRKDAALRGWTPHTKRPDVDNLAKQVLDLLTGRWLTRDESVVRLTCTKEYGPAPSTEVVITPLTEVTSKKEYDSLQENYDEDGKTIQKLRKIPPKLRPDREIHQACNGKNQKVCGKTIKRIDN